MTRTVVAGTWGESADLTGELLTAGRRLAEAASAALLWLALGTPPARAAETAAAYGAAEVAVVRDARPETFQRDACLETLARYCREHSPWAVLFSQSHASRLVAPRLAGRLRSGVVMNGLELGLDAEGRLEVVASAYGGDTRAVYVLSGGEPHIVAMMPGAVSAEPVGRAAATAPRRVEVEMADVRERVRVVEPARTSGPRLEDAQVIVAGGRGLGSAANFRLVEELAGALGGMAGASRPIVDDGWVDASLQIGLTGKIARPALYIAAGVSGASQHMAGCSAAKTIVAINRDPDAAIFRYARYGIVGDCLEVLPQLIRAVRGG